MLVNKAICINTLLIILLIPVAGGAENLCSQNLEPVTPGADELRMHEEEFNFDEAMKSLRFLKGDIYKMLREHKETADVMDSAGFYVGYPNSLSFVQGTLLKQRALLARAALDGRRAHIQPNADTSVDILRLEKAYEEARTDFCKFLNKARYVD